MHFVYLNIECATIYAYVSYLNKFFFQEIAVLSQCRCPYITEYYGSYLQQTKLWIIMEYMAGGSVADLVGFFVDFRNVQFMISNVFSCISI